MKEFLKFTKSDITLIILLSIVLAAFVGYYHGTQSKMQSKSTPSVVPH